MRFFRLLRSTGKSSTEQRCIRYTLPTLRRYGGAVEMVFSTELGATGEAVSAKNT